jgi:hypothetical protein
MSQSPQVDPRQEVFELLLPAAAATRDGLKRVDQAVSREVQLVRPLRKNWQPGQRRQGIGFSRFAYAVDELKESWAGVTGLRYVSSPSQAASNLFLWSLDERWPIRIKHEPVEGDVNVGARRLFESAAPGGDPTIFLTWDESDEGRIIRARFVTVEEPKFSISVDQLVAVAEQPDTLPATQPLAKVSSARTKEVPAEDRQSQ